MFADYCTAAVRTGQDGRKGISALIIPMSSKGVTCRRIENSGVHASGKSEWARNILRRPQKLTGLTRYGIGSTYIEFDDVEVPVSNLLGQENHGFPIIMSSMVNSRTLLKLQC